MGYWIDAFDFPVDMYVRWMKQRKNRRKARYRRKLERLKRRFPMKIYVSDYVIEMMMENRQR